MLLDDAKAITLWTQTERFLLYRSERTVREMQADVYSSATLWTQLQEEVLGTMRNLSSKLKVYLFSIINAQANYSKL